MLELLLLGLALGVAALSSAAETGFYALNRVQLRQLTRRSPSAGLLLALVSTPAAFLCTLLLAKAIADDLAVHGAMALGQERLHLQPEQASLAAALLLTPVMFLLCEVWPKHWALADPLRRTTPLAPLVWLLRWLLAPVTAPVVWLLRRVGADEESAPLRHQLLSILAENRAIRAEAPVLAAAGRALDARGRGLRPFLRRDLPILRPGMSREQAAVILSGTSDGLGLWLAPGGGLQLLDAARLAAEPSRPCSELARELPVLPPDLDLAGALTRLRRLGAARALVGQPGAWEGICDLEAVIGLLLAPSGAPA